MGLGAGEGGEEVIDGANKVAGSCDLVGRGKRVFLCKVDRQRV